MSLKNYLNVISMGYDMIIPQLDCENHQLLGLRVFEIMCSFAPKLHQHEISVPL